MIITDTKPLLRAEMKKRRAALAQAAPLAGNHLAQQATRAMDAAHTWPAKGSVIAGYWPIQSEISPFPLMQDFEDRGYLLALPCLMPSGGDYRMIFRRFRIGDTLEDGPFEISQPLDSANIVEPDILLIPLLAFEPRGVRLGYGGGHYDRVLANLRAGKTITAYGVAFSGQELAEIPFEVHDQPLDGIFTEQGLVEAESGV
jgi:5-formyltetrahydrofolate cyclo-ligase